MKPVNKRPDPFQYGAGSLWRQIVSGWEYYQKYRKKLPLFLQTV